MQKNDSARVTNKRLKHPRRASAVFAFDADAATGADLSPGDIALFYRPRGRDRVISWLTRSPFFHVALCCAPHTLVEAVPKGVRKRDLRAVPDRHPFVIIPAFREAAAEAVSWALTQVGDGYDTADLAVIVLHRIFRDFALNYTVGDRYTCGEFVATAYEKAGRKLFPQLESEDVVPADFARLLPDGPL